MLARTQRVKCRLPGCCHLNMIGRAVKKMDIDKEDVCPISHTPLRELEYPVVLKKSTLQFNGPMKDTVYCGEHLTEWLKYYSITDPVTNITVKCGLASELLEPAPYCDKAKLKATEHFLRSQGFLDGQGGQVSVCFAFGSGRDADVATNTGCRRRHVMVPSHLAEASSINNNSGYWSPWNARMHSRKPYHQLQAAF